MDCRKAAAFRGRDPRPANPGLDPAQNQWMSTEKGAHAALEYELEKAEILAHFRHALDQSYRQLCDAARSDWERLFGKDPADACVTVRVAGTKSNAVRGSGFLKSRREVSKSDNKGSVPRFAH